MIRIAGGVRRAGLVLGALIVIGSAWGDLGQPVVQAAAQQSGAFNASSVRQRLNTDPEFKIVARYWNARVRLQVGSAAYDMKIVQGAVTEFAPAAGAAEFDVKISGALSAWTDHTVAMGMIRGANGGRGERKLDVEGDPVSHVAPYQKAILRIVRLMAEDMGVRSEEAVVADVDRQFDTAVGRYVYVHIRGTQYRVYFEEAGHGSIPLILQHTAGADARQWRYLLEDPDIQKNYRIIAYDMPFHGKSLPPLGQKWWTQEYRLTTDLLMDTILAVSNALKLDRPVFLGCSIGGYLAPDLAYYHPEAFTAVIGVNAAIAGAQVLTRQNGAPPTPPRDTGGTSGQNTSFHPRIANTSVGTTNYENTSPIAPEASRREMDWIYSQGGPGIFSGDGYYYGTDHDLTGGKAEKIDTSKVEVHLLSGEYDRTAQSGPGSGEALAKAIKGATFQVIKGGAHFVISDDYPRFRQYIVPLLNEIHARHPRKAGASAQANRLAPSPPY